MRATSQFFIYARNKKVPTGIDQIWTYLPRRGVGSVISVAAISRDSSWLVLDALCMGEHLPKLTHQRFLYPCQVPKSYLAPVPCL